MINKTPKPIMKSPSSPTPPAVPPEKPNNAGCLYAILFPERATLQITTNRIIGEVIVIDGKAYINDGESWKLLVREVSNETDI